MIESGQQSYLILFHLLDLMLAKVHYLSHYSHTILIYFHSHSPHYLPRSNVGKSTLLNALLSLEEAPLIKALVSEKPGETRHLQFYCVGRNEAPKTPVPGSGSNDMNWKIEIECIVVTLIAWQIVGVMDKIRVNWREFEIQFIFVALMKWRVVAVM